MPGHLLDPESGAAPGEAGAGEHEDQRHVPTAELDARYFDAGHLEVVGHRHRQLNRASCRVKPWTMVEHCIQRNGLRVCDQRSRGAELVGESAQSRRVVGAALRLDPHLAPQRDSMDLLAGALLIPDRAVSCGTAAYGSATTSSTRKARSIMPCVSSARRRALAGSAHGLELARLGLGRFGRTVAKNSAIAVRASCPPSKPRQTVRSRPASS